MAHLPVSAEAMELHHVPPELIHPLSSDVNLGCCVRGTR